MRTPRLLKELHHKTISAPNVPATPNVRFDKRLRETFRVSKGWRAKVVNPQGIQS